MQDLCRLIFWIASDLLRSRVALEAEILVLRQQINVLRRANPKRLRFVSIDRLILGGICRLVSQDVWRIRNRPTGDRNPLAPCGIALAMEIEAALRTTGRDGRNTPAYPPDERRQSVVGSTEDPWRASQARHRCRPDQRGQIYSAEEGSSLAGMEFLRNHADGIAAMDLFVVPTISFRLLYGLLIMGHGRRQLLWFGVTAHPTAEWIANQLTEACGWEQIPRYLIRDRDGAYGEVFIRRLRSIGIRDRPTS